MGRRTILLLGTLAAALVMASGAALALTKDCPSGTTKSNPCKGTKKADTLNGTSGPDYIEGLGKGDILKGFGDSDELFGGGGDDKLFGGDNGTIDDGAEDTLSGGKGSDTYLFGAGWGHDTIIDTPISDTNPNTGNTIVFLPDIPSTSNLSVGLGAAPSVSDGPNTVQWDGDVIDNVVKLNLAHATIYGNNQANGIVSWNGNTADYVSGAGGDDFIRVDDQAGGDQVDCYDGNDTVYFDPGDIISSDCENQNQVS